MSWDPVWEEVFQQSEWGKYPSEDLIRFIARNFYNAADRKEIKILEVGCGPGANLWYLIREGFTVYGIDGSRTAIARAQARLDKEFPGWNGQLVVGDIMKLPFDSGFFDAVIDNAAICCNSYTNSQIIYNELARVAKNGGKLYSRTLAQGCWGDETGQKVGHNAWLVAEGPLLNKGYSRFTDDKEISQLIAGFKIKEVELLVRTVNNRQNQIKEWIIIGEVV